MRRGDGLKGLKLIWFTVAFVVIADQLTKAIVAATLSPYEILEVIPGVLNLVYWHNPGAAFGILSTSGSTGTILLTAISVIALFVIGLLVKTALREGDRLTTFSLSLIGGGAIGNLIDRLRLGEVIDFLDFYTGQYHWPAFNVADCAITIGVFLTLAGFILRPSRKA